MTSLNRQAVTLTQAGLDELVSRCHHLKNLRQVASGEAQVLSRQLKTGAYLLKFRGCSQFLSVPATSVEQIGR